MSSLRKSKPHQLLPDARSARGLRDFQRLVAGLLMRPLDKSFKMQRRTKTGQSQPELISRFVKPSKSLSPFERLEIYNRQYWFRILECFYDDFVGLRAVLGDDRFLRLAVNYLTEHPSTTFTLRNLGSILLSFLEQNPKYTGKDYRLSLQMARLEWAHIEAFDNPALPPLQAKDLHAATAGKIRLRLQPYVTLLRLEHPLDDYLLALRRELNSRNDASNAVATLKPSKIAKLSGHLRREEVHLVVHRHVNRVYYKRLSSAQYGLLLSLQAGKSLEVSCKHMIESAPASEWQGLDIKTWFQDWTILGWLCHRQAKPAK
ncbi:MAG: putative DNA-binding domain-containing protein [Verrucomicrobiota bacterium]